MKFRLYRILFWGCIWLLSSSLTANAQMQNLTAAVLVNSQNTNGYNTSSSSPGEFQRFAERYLQHLQVPYEIFDVSAVAPPADLNSRQLIIAAHSHLALPADWQNAITTAVNGGTGFVNLDSDPTIGNEPHMVAIFGSTGSALGTPATQISIPQAVAPGGASAHYIAASQKVFDGGGLVYSFHADANGIVHAAVSTVLQNAPGTVIARLGNDPLILASTYAAGRAVYFGTLNFLHADRLGFEMGLDDLFWRSLVWAARKPFALRGYPRFWAVQMDDTRLEWPSRVGDLYNPAFTGQLGADGTGGPWKVTGYLYTDNLPKGSSGRAQVIADINAGKLQVSPHSFGDVPLGNMYWNGSSGPLTDQQWLTNMSAIDSFKQGNGGSDNIPSFSRSMVAHFWNLSDNTGYDLWNHFGFRYITSIQKPGFQATDQNNGAERLNVRSFWLYELPPKTTVNPGYTTENYPLFFADDYVVGSRAGLPAQTFFLFTTQYLDFSKYGRPDFIWPNAWPTSQTVTGSVAQLQQYTWRHWSALGPVQLFTHDALNYENATDAERDSVIAQSSSWLNTNGVRHIFMEDLGDYIYARTKSTLSRAVFDGTQLTYTFTGSAANADGKLIPTQLLLFRGDDEGAWQSAPGFTSSLQITRDLPPSVQSITPATGPSTGGTTVTISGSAFTPDVAVYFGQNSATSVQFVNSSTLQAVTPAGTETSVDVKVANASGTASLTAGFKYTPPPRVLVAAYAFDEGSGTTVADASGKGNNGIISGATWSTAGRFGKALSFNGSSSMVTVNDSGSLDLTTGMTLEAWVNPTTLGTVWRTVIMKEQAAGLIYTLYANTNTTRPSGNIYVGGENETRGTAALITNTWTHLAVTYDGTTLRLFVNGTEVSNKAISGSILTSSGALRIGGNTVWGEYFSGLIDEIRIFNRASTVAEIQGDMNTPVGVPDTTPPTISMTAPLDGATVSGTITVSASASDNIGVAGVQFLLDGAPLGTEDTAAPYSISWNSGTTANGSHTLAARARDAAGNQTTSTTVNVTTSNAAPDTTPPTVSLTAPASGATISGTITVSADASDNVGVAGVQFLLDGAPLGVEDTSAPYSISWDSSKATNGSHMLSARARDAVGNQSTSSAVSVTVTGGVTAGLVAAYSVDEGSGTTLADLSGNGNTGTISGATWTTAGKYGAALSFNGSNNWITVNDSASLHLTTGMTLEAWVNPNALGTTWRTVILKENTASLVYSLYANTNTSQPSGHVYVTSEVDTRGTASLALNTWSHLAVTYNGSTLRLFVNGFEVSNKAVGGSIQSSTGALRIGGNSIWGEYFSGLIDEIRIYNRALSASDIQADMNTPLGVPDTTPPTVSITAPGNGATVSGTITVSASASDNIGVAGVQFLLDGAPLSSEDTSAPYSLSWNSATVANGGHNLAARARDAAGNQTTSTAINVTTSNAAPDTTPPTVSLTAPASGATVSGTITVSADASDNVGVAGVQFLLDGASIGSEDTLAPYSISWDSRTAGNGSHSLAARARDAAGNQTASISVPVTISNSIPAALVAAYALNEGTGTVAGDSSGNGNNGTLINGPTWTTGKYASAINFDGANDYVSVPNSSSLTLGNAGTIEAWVKPTTTSRWNGVIAKGTANKDSAHNYALEINRSNRFLCILGSGNTSRSLTSTITVTAGQFYHVACVWNGTNLQLYVNGALNTSTAQNLTPAANSAPVYIGQFGGSADQFAGVIDEVRIYNRALSATEVQTDMNTALVP